MSCLAYQPMNEDILRKYAIIEKLQQGPLPKATFKNHFLLFDQDELLEDPNSYLTQIPLDIRQTYFYRLLNEQLMKEEHEIYLDPQDKKYYLTGNKIPLLIALEEEHIDTIHDQLTSISPGNPYYKQLQSVADKLALISTKGGYSDTSSSSYLVYGRQPSAYFSLNEQMQKLKACNYKDKVLRMTLNTKSAGTITLTVATGLILFSVEKDCLYLIGIKFDDAMGNEPELLTVMIRNIVSIEETDFDNSFYNSPMFQKIQEEMFCVSVEEPFDVEIEFKNQFQIPRRINYLHRQRKQSSLEFDLERNVLIYKDRLRGKGDLKEYLRQYGSYAKVIKPEWLREEMKESAQKALQRYEETSYE